jgi:hypothetical protein
MKLERWALIAEIIGAAAIVVSLIFVGLQIRESNTATYAATYDQLQADMVDWRMELATHPDTVRAWRYFFDPEDVDPPDPNSAYVGKMAMEAIVQIWERAYFAREYGRLNDEEWERYRRGMCNPGYHEAWDRAGLDGSIFAKRFWQEVVVSGCEDL